VKLIIAGSRDYNPSISFILESIRFHNLQGALEIVSGKSKGVDYVGELFADWVEIPVKPFPVEKSDWTKYGKAAGPMRNKQMAKYGDVLLLIWDGKSSGSASMKREMQLQKKPIYEVILKSN